MSDLSATILALNAAAAQGINPYQAFAAQLWGQLHVPAHSGFGVGLRICQAMIGLAAVLAIMALVVTVRNGNFWLSRFRATPAGDILTLNVSCLFFLGVVALAALDIAWAELTYGVYYNDTSNYEAAQPAYRAQLLEPPVWFILASIFWTTSYVATTATFVRFSHRLREHWLKAWMVHAAFSIVLVVLIATFVLFCVGIDTARRAENAMRALVRELMAVNWKDGDGFTFNPEWAPLLQAYSDKASRYISIFNGAFGTLAAVMILNIFVGLPATWSHIRLLRQQLSRNETAVQSFREHGTFHGETKLHTLENRRAAIQRTSQSLTIEVGWTIVTSAVFAGLATWFAVSLAEILASPVQVMIAFIVGFGCAALTSLPVAGVLLMRALRSMKSHEAARPKPAGNWAARVRITTDVHTEVDTGPDHYAAAFTMMERDKRHANIGPAFAPKDLAFISLRRPDQDFAEHKDGDSVDEIKMTPLSPK